MSSRGHFRPTFAVVISIGITATIAMPIAHAESTQFTSSATRHHLELGGSALLSFIQGELAYPEYAISDRTVGGGLALNIAYRSPYFLFPFLDVSYLWLSDNRQQVPGVDGASPTIVDNSMNGLFAYVGPATALGPVRLQLGFGAKILFRHTTVSGPSSSTSNPVDASLSALLSAGFDLVRMKNFSAAIEGRAYIVPSFSGSIFAMGMTGRGNVLSW